MRAAFLIGGAIVTFFVLSAASNLLALDHAPAKTRNFWTGVLGAIMYGVGTALALTPALD